MRVLNSPGGRSFLVLALLFSIVIARVRIRLGFTWIRIRSLRKNRIRIRTLTKKPLRIGIEPPRKRKDPDTTGYLRITFYIKVDQCNRYFTVLSLWSINTVLLDGF